MKILNNLFNTLMTAIRSKIMPIWTKMRLWFSITFWQTKGLVILQKFFAKVLDIRPRHKKDYYSVFGWLVSKRLAFAAVVVVGILCTIYIYFTLPKNLFSGNSSADGVTLRTYKYSAIPLKFYDGDVRILAKDGHLAYEGQVAKAQCAGNGVLYDKEGSKVYDGAFVNSMFSGKGSLYYPQGAVRYQGDFQQNLFHGEGEYLRQGGTPEYTGSFQNGKRNGTGTLFNSGGTAIYNGTFLNDAIVYSDLLKKATPESNALYTGKTATYTCGDEYATSMSEINAVCTALSGTNTLDGEWQTGAVYVLENRLQLDGEEFSTADALNTYLGEPDYIGTTWLTLTEVVAFNRLNESSGSPFGKIEIKSQETLDGVYEVEDYDRAVEAYIRAYQKDGMVYTFFYANSTDSGFLMYSIEKV